ncbi:MAG: hypothetical protein GTO45_08745 [Candidatus Aminicenantes bacterium]|nr:hypothetical protein [Candidatus Aminicenantes bacterium]NIM78919.1 hypothetical protein [Candidatus Aminicenantes bacterium]NIN18179.1 hypothetical protein [Candidatus Aminicenantes bacterium]NIN42078.1 hypothetical protein [Candidatus Aminicenantes bacterium]NIN84831.1 hypothetical protein [Candidatus Aminicenantes bacterium]
MLALDIPVCLVAGLGLSAGGKDLIRSEDKEKNTFLKVVTLMYAAIFIAPIPMYFFLGWPGWECNFMWSWVDNVKDNPLKAAFAFALVGFAVGITYLGMVIGRSLIKKGKDKWVYIGIIALVILMGIIVLLMWDTTFKVAPTYADWKAGKTYSFWTHPFVTGWALTTIYYWGSLAAFYFWLRKKK